LELLPLALLAPEVATVLAPLCAVLLAPLDAEVLAPLLCADEVLLLVPTELELLLHASACMPRASAETAPKTQPTLTDFIWMTLSLLLVEAPARAAGPNHKSGARARPLGLNRALRPLRPAGECAGSSGLITQSARTLRRFGDGNAPRWTPWGEETSHAYLPPSLLSSPRRCMHGRQR
jgi:hypothetical protein